jgi:ATP-binding cassette subfamily F protein 3
VILISHDRALLEAVGSRTIVCAEGRLESHGSGWAEYQRREDERRRDAASAAAEAKPAGKRRAGSKKPAQQAARKAARLEGKIERAETELREVEEELADPAAWSSPGRYERATERHRAAKQAVEDLYAEWEQVQAAAEVGPS